MVPAPRNNQIYKNKVSIKINKGFTLLIIRQYLGNIMKEYSTKSN